MKKNQLNNLSYYRLSLLSFLKESHPQLVNNLDFLETRTELATDAYAQAIEENMSQNEAEETANTVLFDGLHFSKHDTIVNVLWNEFSAIIPESQAKEFAVRIFQQCDEVFSQYQLTDDFTSSAEYDKLYTELVGFISIWLEENEL